MDSLSVGKKYLISGLILLSGLAAWGLTPFIQEIRASFQTSGAVSQSSQAHGEHQVYQMLADRPRMAAYSTRQGEVRRINSQDSIWQWAVHAYGSTINGARIV